MDKANSMSRGLRKQPLIDKNQAFMEFKNGDGREIEGNLEQNKEDLRDRKYRLKNATSEVNRIKRIIDECKETVDNIRRNQGDNEEEVIDEEEFAFIKRLKDNKKLYRSNFDQMRALKEEINIIGQNIEYAKERLISEFEIWYERKFGVSADMPRDSTRKNVQVIEEKYSDDLDPDALAYISAKRNAHNLHKAKKNPGKA